VREKEETVTMCQYCGEESVIGAVHTCAHGQEALVKEYLALLEDDPTTALEYAQRAVKRVALLQRMANLRDKDGKSVAVLGAQIRLDKLNGGLLKLARLVIEEHHR